MIRSMVWSKHRLVGYDPVDKGLLVGTDAKISETLNGALPKVLLAPHIKREKRKEKGEENLQRVFKEPL